jgi:ABC-2 type transport system ATP-binding protein
VAKHDDCGSSAEVELAEGATGDQLLRALVAAEVGLNRFEVVEPSLQAIFIDKVGPEAARAAAQGDR